MGRRTSAHWNRVACPVAVNTNLAVRRRELIDAFLILVPGGGGLEILSDREAEVAWAGDSLSVTWTVKLASPTTIGVPEIAPVAELRLRPFGSAPPVIDQVYPGAPPEAANAVE